MSTGFFKAVMQVLGAHVQRLALRYVLLGTLFLATLACLAFLIYPPFQFQPGSRVSIPYGASISSTGAILEDGGVIRSTILFRAIFIVFRYHSVKSGVYYFPERETVFFCRPRR